MKRTKLVFDRPAELAAIAPPEARGVSRDDVRLLVTIRGGHTHARFRDLPDFLKLGDLLVVNESAPLPASLPASGEIGRFTLNLSTRYGPQLWLAEPRWSPEKPGPLPLEPGMRIQVGGSSARMITPYPGLSRLWFVQAYGDLDAEMGRLGEPIRYGYVEQAHPLEAYRTIFATTPGSAEMPSAARPFTWPLVAALGQRGVDIVSITLHTGVSSLEVEAEDIEEQALYPEPFIVPHATAQAVNAARSEGRRIIAVGTTVVRALESAWDRESGQVRPAEGFTRLYVHPGREIHVVDGLITGMHDPLTSHLAMVYTLAGEDVIRGAYREAVRERYLWHEFGDSHLILPDKVDETGAVPMISNVPADCTQIAAEALVRG